MHAFRFAVTAIIVLALGTQPVFAARGGPMSPEVHCIHTTVKAVSTYFQNDPASGWSVVFNGRIYDPYVKTLQPRITDRSGTSYAAVHAGDAVQICLVDYEKPEKGVCDPVADDRGRTYRFYDYRLHAAFAAPNDNHGCGGA